MSELKQRETSWGWMAEVFDGDTVVAEVMHFKKPGKFHAHDQEEVVKCVAGSGHVVAEDGEGGYDRLDSRLGMTMVVPPGRKHRMEPSDEGMTCLIWYR